VLVKVQVSGACTAAHEPWGSLVNMRKVFASFAGCVMGAPQAFTLSQSAMLCSSMLTWLEALICPVSVACVPMEVVTSSQSLFQRCNEETAVEYVSVETTCADASPNRAYLETWLAVRKPVALQQTGKNVKPQMIAACQPLPSS
jgi:hypothetical protein